MHIRVLWFVSCSLLCSAIAFGQAVAGFGGISGVVRDASGGSVPEAKIVVSNAAKGIRRTLSTNESGIFTAPALVPDEGYSVTAQKEGFTTYEVNEIQVQVGQNVNLNILVQVATSAQQIEVTGVAPVVEDTKTGVSEVVNSRQIQDLPINGRRVDSFVLLTPAVVSDGTFGLVSFRGISGGNAFLTDGNDTTNQYYNENAGRTRISSQISQDAVQEFQVLSSGYSAEFGRASGGVINTVTRSGGNGVHGTGYWFFRNESFSAKDRYAATNPPETRHQAGGSIGGPITKDKLFYFFNGEVTRREFPLVSSLTTAPLFNSAGRFSAACDATPAQCQAAQKYFDRFFQTVERRADQELGFLKLDWRPTERHSVSTSFNYQRWVSPNGIQTQAALTNGAGVGNNGDSTVRVRYGRLNWTAIPSNSVVNEFRYGWFKDRLFDTINEKSIPAETGMVQFNVAGANNLGVANYMPRLNPSEQRHQFADNVSWTTGRHIVKFGFDFANTRDVSRQVFNERGTYTYGTFTDFARDFSGNALGVKNWQSFTQVFGKSNTDLTIRDYSFYIQDQYRVASSLTLNYGVRYEYAQLPQPALAVPDYPQSASIASPKTNFAPRFGIAYSFNQSKTVLRAGYGIFYARYQGALLNTLHLNNGVTTKSLSFRGPADHGIGPVFPLAMPSTDREPPAGTVNLSMASPDLRNPYTQQGDIGIEHALGNTMGLTVSYIWSRGLHLTTVRDINIGPPGPNVSYSIQDRSGQQAGTYTTPTYLVANRLDKRWNRVNSIESGGNSYYNAMVVQLRKRLSRGLEASAAYTWAHAIDFNQGGGNDNIFFSSGPRSLNNGDYRGDKSSSANDQRHRMVFTSLYQPTFTKSTSRVARYLVNNWQLSQITTFASAQPATPTVQIASSAITGGYSPFTLNGFGGSSRVPFVPAASLDVDQVYRTDARLSKILPIAERFQVYLNFEAFNVFNHVSDTGRFGTMYTATRNVLAPVARYGEGTVSAGFPDGTNARRAQVSVRLVF